MNDIVDHVKRVHRTARLARDKKTASTLGIILGDIQTEELRTGAKLPEGRVVKMLKKFVENCEETHDDDGARIVRYFLPEEMSEAEVRSAIQNIIETHENADMKLVMQTVMKDHGSKIDGNMAKQIAKEML